MWMRFSEPLLFLHTLFASYVVDAGYFPFLKGDEDTNQIFKKHLINDTAVKMPEPVTQLHLIIGNRAKELVAKLDIRYRICFNDAVDNFCLRHSAVEI